MDLTLPRDWPFTPLDDAYDRMSAAEFTAPSEPETTEEQP